MRLKGESIATHFLGVLSGITTFRGCGAFQMNQYPEGLALDWCLQALAQIESSGEQTSESVVHGFLQVLLASEVAFGGEN